uniref:uncharacterized protein LOC122579595 isoform X2 n=1 Tax=Erigeron canadensis TaxID=72917 RepID=UPI001CB92293|nr:uncharacterized protein LOC122579595 isoform X2 [Erigeron canadensis]
MEPKLSSLSLSETTHNTFNTSTPPPSSSYSTSSSSSVNRLWRPAAQRNMKNQWSRFNSLRQQWLSSSSTARSHATSLVNAFLSQRYMKDMELGVLSDMPNIQKKACWKLLKQQVATVVSMVNTSTSLRCFLKGGTNSPFIQFSSNFEDINDNGDGGGVPVFTFWSISSFEKIASELVQMFKLELNLKRLLVVEFLSLTAKEDLITKKPSWSDEIYEGEHDDLSRCNLDCREFGLTDLASPNLDGCKSRILMQPTGQPDSDVVQIYLTAWLTDVNMDKQRVDDIFSEVGEEMHVNFVS